MKNVTLKQLRAFAAVIRTGSVTAAAKSLNVTPPAVTLQMQLLADQTSLPLIERAPHRIIATDAGREVLAAADRVEAAISDCAAALAGMADIRHGRVAVGIISTAKYFAPRALAEFARAHPAIELRLIIGNRAEILEGLADYSLDVAITGRPPREFAVEASVIGEHPHVVVASPQHALVGCTAVPARRLDAETFLVREPGSGTRGVMERFFQEAGLAPKIGMQISSNETIKQAVMAGLGVALISGHTVEAEVSSGRLAILDIQGLPIIRQWYVVHLRDRRMMPAAQIISRFLTEEAGTYLPRLDPAAAPQT